MSNREQFFHIMKFSVQDFINERGIEGRVELQEVVKNNDQVLTGLVLLENKNNISPCIYLDDMYERYKSGMPLVDIATQVTDLMVSTKNPEVDYSRLCDYEKAKDHLLIRLVGVEENDHWLDDKVWMRMGDFAKVIYMDFGEFDNGQMSAAVNRSHLALMGVSKDEIFADAQKNLEQTEYSFSHILSMISDMAAEMELDDVPIPEGSPAMYILSNKSKAYGAAMIARADVLKSIGDKLGEDYYVLPSSIHETLIVPVSNGATVEELNNMVKEVNETVVSPQEKLSDHVQYYDREKEQLRRAAEPAEKEVAVAKAPKEKEQER